MIDGHRVSITFLEGYPSVKLICPAPPAVCSPPLVCTVCDRSLDEDESECHDCSGEIPRCWLQSWFDDAPEELLQGEIVIPVDYSWDARHEVPVVRIHQVIEQRIGTP
jgi:hypothetical protein